MTATERARLVEVGQRWAKQWLGRAGRTSANALAEDTLVGFYCGIGQARLGRKLIAQLPDVAGDLLLLAIRQTSDPRVVGNDGEVKPEYFLYEMLNTFYDWKESTEADMVDLGTRCLNSWDALVLLPNPAYELALTVDVNDSGAGGLRAGRPVPRSIPPSDTSMEDLLAQLHALIGLREVKEQISGEVAGKRVNAERARRGLPVVNPNMHMVFSGNPGTGKTTVARIVAGIYHRAGVLSRGQLVEVGPGDMMGIYQGENTQRAQEVLEAAIGGVLLFDEAYSLAGTDRGPMEFQQQVIDVLVKGMEDHRDDLVVIFTGYTLPMERFLRSNAGLESRVGEWVTFPDYTDTELMAVLDLFCDQYRMELELTARDKIALLFAEVERNERFGNARLVRNVFEDLVTQASTRMVDEELGRIPTKVLNGITFADVQVVSDEVRSGRANDKRVLPVGFHPPYVASDK